MSQDIMDVITAADELVALGEPTHAEPAFGLIRNELVGRLAEHGFRSVALEVDRVAALIVNDYVQDGVGTLDAVLREGFSHGWGEFDANRRLVAWMREYNRGRPPEGRLAFHGFDTPMETMSAPSPRSYLEHARDYLGLDTDIAALTGDDERWSRTEAVMDPEASPGATAEADRLRVLADDMLTTLHARAPELIAASSRETWSRARTRLTAGLDLLRYHAQAARRVEPAARLAGLTATRDALMARNLVEIRAAEARRGGTLVFTHNLHLRRTVSTMAMGGTEVSWYSAGAILEALGERCTVIMGSIGRSAALGLGEPDPDTFEGRLSGQVTGWGLVRPGPGRPRTDTASQRGYFPLDQATLDGAAAVLHIAGA
ncbi:erythromycin esterase family protein [Actinokineospora sp. UTMC 2448]|uniref:erythromycin esterase family protein n=1 Tax=Actinokineospora sp. UTMC 2448 TaxID=2268449 RepID=UPI002164BB9A|nr:erythromycin esterase family protein [Actinokineospora sp. UTMC 2448]